MEKFGERIDPVLIRKKFMNMEKGKYELVPSFNLKFSNIIRGILEDIRPNDDECLVVYLGEFDKKMSFLFRDKEPTTLYQAYQMAIDIEKKLRYSMMKGHRAVSVGHPNTSHVDRSHG